jgi:hypothetical protein
MGVNDTPDFVSENDAPSGKAAKPRGKPFERGNQQSKGRTPGSRNKKSEAQSILETHAASIVRNVLALGFKGDRVLAKVAFERVTVQVRRDLIEFALPRIRTLPDIIRASQAVLAAMADGQIGVEDAGKVMDLLHKHGRLVGDQDWERRLAAAEQKPDSGNVKRLQPTAQPPAAAEESSDAK